MSRLMVPAPPKPTPDGTTTELSAVSRREALRVGLAAAVLLLVAGCSSLRRGSDQDTAYSNLRKALDGLTEDEGRQARLTSIAQQIEERCRALTREHDEFRESFDALSRQRETGSAELTALVDGFRVRRTQERDTLLRMQDELRRELTEEEWATAVAALNETQDAYKRPSVGGG